LDNLSVEQCREFESELYKYVETMYPTILKSISEKKTLDDALKAEMEKVVGEFRDRFASERQAAAKTA
ncbi:MAG: F0F1 ATP synthase subunit alpha, partial [Terriglobales bacterium]